MVLNFLSQVASTTTDPNLNTSFLSQMVGHLNVFLETAVTYVWSTPMVLVLLGTGLTFTLTLGFIQLRGFAHAIDVIRGKFTHKDDEGDISHFQALTTALSATVGLGNIAGVAVAISYGGPGAVFWMIMTGFLGMATKFAECTLAIKYREFDKNGCAHGGPMYYIVNGLGKKWKPLALFFAFATMCASFGAANMFQTNQVASILNANFSVPKYITGIVLAIMTAVVIIGGIKRIGMVTSKLIPVMAGTYVVGALIVIFGNVSEVPHMLYTIFHDAFSGTAAIGAFEGIAVREVFIQGVRRACFSNEAGMGSSPIAHSAATTKEPVREGVVALLEPFIDTVLVCTMTALVILISGAWRMPESGDGVLLTASAFNSVIPGFGQFFVPIAVLLFAYSTLLSWSYYGEIATDFMFGPKSIKYYKAIFCFLAFVGAVWSLGPILSFSDMMLGLMVIPNVIALLLLSRVVIRETNSYYKRLRNNEFKTYK